MNDSNKNNEFKTPEGYFDGLTDKLMDKLSSADTALPTGDGFNIPKDYFESLNDKIKAKVNEKETKVVQLHSYKKYLGVAASIAAIVLVFLGLNWNTTEEPNWDDLVNSDIESYFEFNELGLTSYEISEVLPLDDLDLNNILEDQLNEANVIEYLNDNIDDFEDLNLDNDE